MKRKLQKAVSVLLVFSMLCCVLAFTPIGAGAAETDETVAASTVKTRDEAVAWLNSQNGATYDFNGANGTQCVEFVKAYVNWLMTGNAWQDVWNRPTLNGNTIWQNSLWGELGWAVYYNSADFMPEPGDIFSAGTNNGNHTGIVISSDLNTAVIADANARDSEWSNGDPVLIHTINWRSASSDSPYGATHYIRPNFTSGGHNPEGTVDVIEGGNGKIHVRGWAFDRDDFGNQIPIHVYIGGRSGDANAEGHSITANTQRTDVNSVYGCGDWHGFDAEISTSKRGNQPVYIYALNIGGGNDNPQIGEGTANISEAVDPIDVGSIFYAKLAHADSGKYITQENSNGENGSNVALYQDDEEYGSDSYQLWKFERQVDLSYKITNIKTGHCLDVYGSYTANETNIQAHTDNDGNNQRWYFVYGNGSAFSLVPKCAQNSAIDLPGNKSENGANIQLYQRNQSAAQLFDVYQIEFLLGETKYNGNTYKLFNNPVSWDLAKEICAEKGGHLVTITSEAEEKAVSDLRSKCSNPYVWIGATSESGSWKWVTGESLSYTNWDSGQPDNYEGKEKYACIWGNGKWNDYDNDAYLYVNCYICEFDKIEPSSVTLSKSTLSLEVGKTETLTATVSPTNATDKTVTWTSSDSKVATVANGKVSAVGAGPATITAKTTNGKTATCQVTVKASVSPDAAQYKMSNATACAGSNVELIVSIENNPGIISMRNQVEYDASALELVGVEDCKLLAGYTNPSPTINSPYSLRWADSLATQNNTANGNLVKLSFRIKEDTSVGDYVVSVKHNEARDTMGTKVEFASADATISVIDFLLGDIDNDGEISDWDAILLNRFLADWPITINEKAADIDKDGEISDWDAITLERYLAGWDIKL